MAHTLAGVLKAGYGTEDDAGHGPHGEVYSSYSGASVWLIQRKSPTSNTDLGCLHRCVCVFTEFYLPHLPHSFFYLIMSQSTESYSSHTMSTVKIENNNVSYRLF